MRIASAFVELRPDSLGFRSEAKRAIQQALAAINASVPLSADDKSLRQDVRRAAASAVAGAKIDVPVTADSGGLRSEVRRAASAAAAGQEIGLDVTARTERARDALGRFVSTAGDRSIDLPVTADATGLRGEVRRAAIAAAAGQDIKVGVTLDDRKIRPLVRTLVGGIAGAGTALGFLVIPPAFLQGIAAATSGLVAMAGAVVAVAAPLGQLGGLLPALGVGALALGAGFGVVAGALSGVGGALKAYTSEQKEAASAAVSGGQSARAAAQAQEAAAEAVENATDRLAQAQENQVRDAERSAEAIADAQDAVVDAYDVQRESAERSAEAIADANDRLVQAQEEVGEVAERTAEQVAGAQRRMESAVRSLADAEKDAAETVRDLADARRQAAEELEDQTLTVERAALTEERARLNVERARQRQAEVNRDSKATSLERRDAALDVREAELSLKEVIERRADDERKLNDLRRKGIDGADGVVDAQERVATAQQAVIDAQRETAESTRDLARAQRDAAKDNAAAQQSIVDAQRDVAKAHATAAAEAVRAQEAVADAVKSLARTERDAGRSARDAQDAVADAGRDLERAMRRAADVAEEAGSSGAASIDKFALAMSKLSPAAQSFVRALIDIKGTFKELGDTAAQGLLPGLERGLLNVKPLLDSLHPSISLIARTLGTFTDKLGALLSGPASLAGFAALGEASAAILERLGDAALVLLPPLGQLLVAAAPLAVSLADMAVHGAKVFAAFVDGKAKTGDLAGVFERTESTLRLIGSITSNIGGALRGVFQAAMPTGLEYLGLLDRSTEKLRNLVRSDTGQSGLRRFFEDSKPLVLELTGLFGDLVRGLGGIGASLAPQLTPVIAQIREQLVPVLLSMVDSIDAEFLSSLLAATTGIAQLIAAFAQPTGALKLILEGLGTFAGLVASLLTDLGPVSVLLSNMGTALAFVGTAVAGIKIARLLSDFKGVGAVRAELSGVEAAAGAAGAKVGGLGAAAKLLGLAGVFLAAKGTIDDLAPSIDKTTQKLLSMPVSVKDFDKEVEKLRKPSFFEGIAIAAKATFSQGGLFNGLQDQAKLAADAASASFRKLAEESPQFALNLVQSMKEAGRPTAEFEQIIRDLGLGQRFMAEETAKATQKIKDQAAASRDATLAEVDLLDAIDRLSAGLAESKAGFDENTAAGRENIRNREGVLSAVERNIEALIRDGEQNGIDARQVDELRGRMEELKNKYPELAGQIDTFKNDFNRSLEGVRDREVKLVLKTGISRENDTNLGTAGDPRPPGGLEDGGQVAGRLPRRGPTDTIPAWLAPNEFVIKAPSVRAVGPETLAYINEKGKLPGFSIGGYVDPHAVAPGFAAGGLADFKMLLPSIEALISSGRDFIDGESSRIASAAQAALDEEARKRAASASVSSSGGGSIGGGLDVGTTYQGILSALDRSGQDYTVTSAYRAGDPGFHGRGKAVDLVGDMRAIFHTIAGFSGVNELFHDPIGYYIDEGRRFDGAIGDHDDHVHAATFDSGGVLEPGWNRVNNTTGARESLVPAGDANAEILRVMAELRQILASIASAQRDIVLAIDGQEFARVAVPAISREQASVVKSRRRR